MSEDLDSAIRTGAPSAFGKDAQPGQSVEGIIIEATVQDMRKFDSQGNPTNESARFDDGNPMRQIVVQLQTEERLDSDDDGRRSVRIKTWGDQRAAILDAVRSAGYEKLTPALAPGNRFKATLTGLDPSTGIPKRLYAYGITKAQANLDAAVAEPAPASFVRTPAGQPDAAPAPVSQVVQDAAEQKNEKLEKAKTLIGIGMTDDEIGKALGMVPSVVAAIRTTVTDVAPF